MIRFVSAIMIFSAAALGGKTVADNQRKKCERRKEIIAFLISLGNRLKLTKMPLDELINDICKTGFVPEFVQICADNLRGGKTFPQAWSAGIKYDEKFAKSESGKQLLLLGSRLGTSSEEQLSAVRLCTAELEKLLSDEEEKCRKYSGIFPALGVLAGVWAAIILL